jgi:hypothetical protein
MAGTADMAMAMATLESAAPDVRSSAARWAGPAPVDPQVEADLAAAGPVEDIPAADVPVAAVATVAIK